MGVGYEKVKSAFGVLDELKIKYLSARRLRGGRLRSLTSVSQGGPYHHGSGGQLPWGKGNVFLVISLYCLALQASRWGDTSLINISFLRNGKQSNCWNDLLDRSWEWTYWFQA